MFYKYAWDPKLIIGQIISVQCLYYVFLAGSLYILDSIFLSALSLEQIFSYHALHIHNQAGWVVTISFFLNALLGAVCLKYIVERSKKCLDHAATVTIIHLVMVSIFSGFPSTASWWIIQIICMIVMAILGEYLCMRKELMDIPLARAKELDSTPILLRPPITSIQSSSSSHSTPQSNSPSPLSGSNQSVLILEEYDSDGEDNV
ncbi:hypothetical protein SAMD00019534_093130, partial [Acytostelium subglobosum LB1]|uniref:hypothetical protein n=1 Tax=Acytostelium subglobosum LB1 TaxID=1410327 RepID=UPI000644CF19